MDTYFSLDRLWAVFPKILGAFPTTLLIVAFALLIGCVVGMLVAFVRVHRIPVLSQIAAVYVSFLRSTPEIVQLFIVYYGVPLLIGSLLHVDLDNVDALYYVIIAFGINESAFLAELFRGGLEAVPVGQYEAGASIGLTRWQTFRRVIIPQAVRTVIPGFGIETIVLFQNTSLAATLGVADMVGKAQMLGVATYHYLEGYVAAAVVFIVVSIVLEVLFQYLSRRFSYSRDAGRGVRDGR